MSQIRPNILLIVFDSLSEQVCQSRCKDLPALAGFRNGSRCFTKAYAPSPESGPATASLFTGLDMAVHGVWTGGVALPERETTLAQRLADHGYATALVGRRHLAGVSNWTTEHARPFEYANFDWAHGPLHRSRQNAYLNWLQQVAPDAYATIFPAQANPDDTEIQNWQHKALTALPDALSFNHWVGGRIASQCAQQSGEEPFLAVAGFVIGEAMGAAPDPASPGEPINQTALRQADAALGAILQGLEHAGRADTTAVVVTAARGTIADAGSPMQESALHVPLMIRAPGHVAQTVDTMVSTLDLAATVFDLARVTPPRRMQGTSLMADNIDDVARGWALSRLRHPAHDWQTALRMARWKLVMTHGHPKADTRSKFSLFDLLTDPDETRDLADAPPHQATLERMVDLMIDARVALEDRTEPRIAKF
ncbi:MAG: sulfatase-like hydrolase/transferase [Celeribacter sp.]